MPVTHVSYHLLHGNSEQYNGLLNDKIVCYMSNLYYKYQDEDANVIISC